VQALRFSVSSDQSGVAVIARTYTYTHSIFRARTADLVRYNDAVRPDQPQATSTVLAHSAS